MKKKIGIINLGSHNLFSIFQAIKNLNHHVKIVNHSKEIKRFDIIILPGVGTFNKAINLLNLKKMTSEIKKFSKKKDKKIIGICLGMQLMLSEGSEFGKKKGLNLIEGDVLKLDKIKPNIGWKKLKLSMNKSHNSLNVILKKNYFYFVHSFYCKLKDKNLIKAKFDIEKNQYCGVFIKNNLIGIQFHPEKSGEAGLKLLKIILI